MSVKFLGEDVELSEFSIRQADEIQAILMQSSKFSESGEAQVNIEDFKASMYLAIEYGTVDKKITRDYLQDDLKASQADDVQKLYDEVMKLNGQG